MSSVLGFPHGSESSSSSKGFVLKPDRSNSDAWLRYVGLVLRNNGLDFLVRDAENVRVGLKDAVAIDNADGSATAMLVKLVRAGSPTTSAVDAIKFALDSVRGGMPTPVKRAAESNEALAARTHAELEPASFAAAMARAAVVDRHFFRGLLYFLS